MALVTQFSAVRLVTDLATRRTSIEVSAPQRVAFVNGGVRGQQGIQGPEGDMPPGVLEDVVYESSAPDARVVAYTLDGEDYVVSYPNAFTMIRTGNGKVRTATLDVLGRIVGITVV